MKNHAGRGKISLSVILKPGGGFGIMGTESGAALLFIQEESIMKLQIGEKIKALRRARGVTQEQLAEMLDVSNQSVSRWESGVSQT